MTSQSLDHAFSNLCKFEGGEKFKSIRINSSQFSNLRRCVILDKYRDRQIDQIQGYPQRMRLQQRLYSVQLSTTLLLTNYVHCNSLLTAFLFAILFVNVYKGQTKIKTETSSNWLDLQRFKVVAEVASFVGNPVDDNKIELKTSSNMIKIK